jgi:O-antigen/teichoic acid export membrane protein
LKLLESLTNKEYKNSKFNILKKEKFKKLLKGSFIRNVFTVASGAAIAQLIGVLFSPLITRIYGPEVFGVLGVFVALTSILAPVVALTYPMAIVIPKSEEEAKGIIKLSLYVGATFSIIIAFGLSMFGKETLILMNMEELIPFIIFIPFFLFFSAILQVIEQWIIRKELFKVKASASVYQAFLLNSSKVGIGYYSSGAAVLILLTTLGQVLGIILLAFGAKRITTSKFTFKKGNNEDKESVFSLAKKHKDFPIFRASEMFINGVTQSLPVLMLTVFFGPAAAGLYSIGRRLLSMPAQIIGKSVGDVFYPRIAEAAHNKEKLSRLVIKATLSLVAIGFIPFGIIIVFGPLLFSFIFGTEWAMAGEYARWMALWTYFTFINNPSVRTLPVISEQKFLLVFTNINLVIRLGMLAIGAYFFKSDVIAIALYSIAGAILNIVLILQIIRKCKFYDELKIVS